MKIYGSILLLMVALLLVTSCSRPSNWAKEVISGYNDAVILAYRTGDTSRLREVAGEKEARNLGVLIETKRNAGLVLEATLESLEITAVQNAGPEAMSVDTRELWRYYDRPLAPGATPGPVIKAKMAMRYACAREGGRWKVVQIRTLANEMTK